jgi:hypothetical protein
MFAATSRAGGNEQLQRMLDLLAGAVRRPGAPAGEQGWGEPERKGGRPR